MKMANNVVEGTAHPQRVRRPLTSDIGCHKWK